MIENDGRRDVPEAPSNEEVRGYLTERRNWGRWGDDDETGALNLVTPERRLAGMRSVRTGDAISLSRPLATWTGTGNPLPSQHFVTMAHHGGENLNERREEAPGGSGTDYYGLPYHGVATTHLDALCHVWDADGMYNGRDPDEHYTFGGVTFGGVQNWATGLFTRAVVLDVPRLRGTDFVTEESPVHGWELEQILTERQITIEPGDAVCVYAGREKWQSAHPDRPYGRVSVSETLINPRTYQKPGLHASCLPFLRDHDVSSLVWDMLDSTPFPYDVTYTVHGAIPAYGLALIDNAVLEGLAQTCAERAQDDFLLVVIPLLVPGGTGSPVNPIAIL